MARRTSGDDDLLMEEDELTAAFLGDDDTAPTAVDPGTGAQPTVASDEWDENEDLPGQLAVDVY
ncbi:MAG: Hsp20/alpha crystallin family protein, partial [Candidatus Saccharimonadales bacterium]